MHSLLTTILAYHVSNPSDIIVQLPIQWTSSNSYYPRLRKAFALMTEQNLPLLIDCRSSTALAMSIVHSTILGDMRPGLVAALPTAEYPSHTIDPDVAFVLHQRKHPYKGHGIKKRPHITLLRPFASIPREVLEFLDPTMVSKLELPRMQSLIREMIVAPEHVVNLTHRILVEAIDDLDEEVCMELI